MHATNFYMSVKPKGTLLLSTDAMPIPPIHLNVCVGRPASQQLLQRCGNLVLSRLLGWQ
jgi:hypothetical protein